MTSWKRDHGFGRSHLRSECAHPGDNNGDNKHEDGDRTKFDNIDLECHSTHHDYYLEQDNAKTDEHPPAPQGYTKSWRTTLKTFTSRSTTAWWKEEYINAAICAATSVCLVVLLSHYDNKVMSEFNNLYDWALGPLHLNTVIVALITVLRLSLKSIVDAAVSQGAWIWVSEGYQRQQKRPQHAHFSDFKVFDDASRGLSGSVRLLWRMKFKHLGCVGAAIIILVQGFESFSQQMVAFEERPYPVVAGNDNGVDHMAAPPPPRAEV